MALTPVDLGRCQAEKPGNGPFIMGGAIGDPRNGYRVRCDAVPSVVVREKSSTGGAPGAMSLCRDCLEVFDADVGIHTVDVEEVQRSQK